MKKPDINWNVNDNNIQNDCDRFKERNGPSNIYDDKKLKLLQKHE